jgi:hypothetical protein
MKSIKGILYHTILDDKLTLYIPHIIYIALSTPQIIYIAQNLVYIPQIN